MGAATFGDCLVDRLYEAKARAGKDRSYRLDRYELVRIVNDELAKLNAGEAAKAPPCVEGSAKEAKSPSGLIEYTPETLEALRLRICGWAHFNRRPTTKWSEKEIKALKKVFPYDLDDISIIERWYNAAKPQRRYCRGDIITLLNNWNGERDRAQTLGPCGERTPAPARDYSRI